MFGDEDDLTKFNESYRAIQYYMRRGYVQQVAQVVVALAACSQTGHAGFKSHWRHTWLTGDTDWDTIDAISRAIKSYFKDELVVQAQPLTPNYFRTLLNKSWKTKELGVTLLVLLAFRQFNNLVVLLMTIE